MPDERHLPGPVEKLRDLLDREDIDWTPVRDYPNATYIPGDPTDQSAMAASLHTVWWQGPVTLEFMWGHNFEFHDPTPEAVVDRLKGLR